MMDQPTRRNPWRAFLAGAAALLVLLAALGLAVVLTGAYDVAASSPHSAVGRWILHGTTENSVRRQASGIEPPAAFTVANVTAGAAHYKAMCQQCHGGPGTERAEFAEGLNPKPPLLGPELDEWQPRDIFWIVDNGIKMSAMPAFGETHSNEDIWNIVAFVEQLPKMSAEAYRAYPSEEDEAGEESGHEHHSH